MSIDNTFFDRMKVIRYPNTSRPMTHFGHSTISQRATIFVIQWKKHMYVDNFLPQIRKDKADHDSLPVAVP